MIHERRPVSDQTLDIVQRIADLEEPNRQAVGTVLRAEVPITDTTSATEFHDFEIAQGPFSTGDFRRNLITKGKGLLVLEPREEEPIHETSLDLESLGEPASRHDNMHIPPEGTETFVYDINGVEVKFQFHDKSRTLRSLAFEWQGTP